MNEYHIKLVIEPETYDYGENEIAYRVYVEKFLDKELTHLISERTLPVLTTNQKFVDNFSLKITDDSCKIVLINSKNKKSMIKKIIINDIQLWVHEKRSAFYTDKYVHIVCHALLN